jgi:signal peptidase
VLALLALLALAAAMLLPPVAGLERYVITGGSMGDALPRGSIAYEEVVPVARIGAGDVITYRPPNHSALVTHRVVWIGRDGLGARLLRTRGDANPERDPWTFRLNRSEQARVVFHLPLAGYALAALSVHWVRVAVLGGPALLIAICAFGGAWRELRPRAA